ncbi:hypothetical protein LSAT2_024827 [Lamellibrachia satsuma]|nr:hypothetical protein LSAT2_024827 [Lamellibrachia satsuma]
MARQDEPQGQRFFSSRNIPWRNMVGYASDNTKSMVGERNSVLSRLLEKQPKLIDLGCICHLENLCVVDACKKLLLPIDEHRRVLSLS